MSTKAGNVIRQIVWSDRFESDLKQAKLDEKTFGEAIAGVDCALARDPLIGFPTNHPEIRAIRLTGLGKPCLIYYAIGKQDLVLVALVTTP